MSFTDFEKLRAIAIVNVFETGRPFGDYSALAVLNDGAGISYGISQFTHRSGTLAAVIARYLELGGQIGRPVLKEHLGLLRSASSVAIAIGSQNRQLKAVLRAAAVTREMRDAQHYVAYRRFLLPAVAACEGSGFTLPLSLAVVYDSINHGSWETIRDRVRVSPTSRDFEKRWITAYVKARHEWLRSIPRLRPTAYRTSFFLAQIIAGNWHLELPLKVNGFALNASHFSPNMIGVTASAAGHQPNPSSFPNTQSEPSDSKRSASALPASTAPPPKTSADRERWTSTLRKELTNAFEKYDRLESVVQRIVTRADSAKSLWTTVAGTAWQAFWAVVSFFIGLPREVWLAVAIIAAVLMIIYLYRQFALGRIRELSGLMFLMPPTERREASVPTDNE